MLPSGVACALLHSTRQRLKHHQSPLQSALRGLHHAPRRLPDDVRLLHQLVLLPEAGRHDAQPRRHLLKQLPPLGHLQMHRDERFPPVYEPDARMHTCVRRASQVRAWQAAWIDGQISVIACGDSPTRKHQLEQQQTRCRHLEGHELEHAGERQGKGRLPAHRIVRFQHLLEALRRIQNHVRCLHELPALQQYSAQPTVESTCRDVKRSSRCERQSPCADTQLAKQDVGHGGVLQQPDVLR
jgi:hypothetical protein